MPDLPEKKVGIVACSGEELPEGTVTRLASLRVLEQLRPDETVTICLPLFLAGGEQDRAFARFYPTIAVDGCDKRCAARGTAMHSGSPAAEIIVTDLVVDGGLGSGRRLSPAGEEAVEAVAGQIAREVDELLGLRRRKPAKGDAAAAAQPAESGKDVATCACGSGIPVQRLQVNGETVTFIALPRIFEMLHEQGLPPVAGSREKLLKTVNIYTPIPEEEEEAYGDAVMRAYAAFCEEES